MLRQTLGILISASLCVLIFACGGSQSSPPSEESSAEDAFVEAYSRAIASEKERAEEASLRLKDLAAKKQSLEEVAKVGDQVEASRNKFLEWRSREMKETDDRIHQLLFEVIPALKQKLRDAENFNESRATQNELEQRDAELQVLNKQLREKMRPYMQEGAALEEKLQQLAKAYSDKYHCGWDERVPPYAYEARILETQTARERAVVDRHQQLQARKAAVKSAFMKGITGYLNLRNRLVSENVAADKRDTQLTAYFWEMVDRDPALSKVFANVN